MRMENVFDYDFYELDFHNVALKDYWNKAEEMLLDAIEQRESDDTLIVSLPDYKCADGMGYSFLFDVAIKTIEGKETILLCYAGYF